MQLCEILVHSCNDIYLKKCRWAWVENSKNLSQLYAISSKVLIIEPMSQFNIDWYWVVVFFTTEQKIQSLWLVF